MTPEAAARIAWASGSLWFLLDSSQREVYLAFRACKEPKFVLDVSRRWGKSTMMVVCAIEDCLRIPKAQVKYGAATQDMVREIVMPLFEWALDGGAKLLRCPDAMRPEWKASEMAYVFPNGSRIKVVGLDIHPNRLRGTALDGGYLDECGFVEGLEYVVQSILVPQMQGRPHAKILMGSTPPDSPGHEWTTKYVVDAKKTGAYARRSIEDNPRLSRDEKDFFINEAGGRSSITCRREYFAEHVVDESLAVIPEFIEQKSVIVAEHPTPIYRDCYVSMDPGFSDLTAIVFAYYDFANGIDVIEDELDMPRANTATIADAIAKKEASLWGKKAPHRRVSDVDLRLISDLNTQHGLVFSPTPKDDKEAAINALRLRIGQGKLRIHPRCKSTIAHLEHAIWKKSRVTYERSGAYGHFDFIDALVYLVRNIDRGRNPYPRFLRGERPDTHFMGRHRGDAPRSKDTEALASLFRKRAST